jgi:hypothetical protein
VVVDLEEEEEVLTKTLKMEVVEPEELLKIIQELN